MKNTYENERKYNSLRIYTIFRMKYIYIYIDNLLKINVIFRTELRILTHFYNLL